MIDLRCLIVDDEPLAIDIVLNYLQRLDIRSIATADNGIDAFRQLQQSCFDLLFLDIEMPQLTGFELLKSLPHRPLVVITTAYRDYAVEGFEWSVLDYLVKPFSFARFLQTMEKAARAIQPPLPLSPPPDPAAQPPDEKDFLFLKTDRHWVKVEIAAILYIESLKDYIRVYTSTGDWLCHLTLTDITSRLPPEKFCRVHRSYTIALARIDQVRHHCAHIGGTAIPIARAHRQEIYRRLGQ
jgi:DNA-binding LytR/AlgR family response regulator